VLVVGTMPPPIHGSARVTALVVDNLAAAGPAPIVVNTSGTESGIGLRHHLIHTAAHLRAIQMLIRRRRSLTSMYVTGGGGPVIWYEVVIVALARLLRLPVVFHHHSFRFLNTPSWALRALTVAGGPGCVHVVLCTRMAQALRARYPAVRDVRVCSNAGLIGPVQPRPPADDAGSITLGHLGNLVFEKGLPLVLDSLRRVREAGIDARLLLGGPVRSAEAERLLEQAQTEFGAALQHLGPIPPDEVDDFYRRVDLFLFPSTWMHEAEPLVVLEAARWGVPSVALAVGCVAALVPRPELLVPVGEDFAAAAASVAARLVEDRDALRPAVVEHFTARRQQALAQQRDLVATLSAQQPGE
jgi:glycosyltransferase involved in cell wall biosynthesis